MKAALGAALLGGGALTGRYGCWGAACTLAIGLGVYCNPLRADEL